MRLEVSLPPPHNNSANSGQGGHNTPAPSPGPSGVHVAYHAPSPNSGMAFQVNTGQPAGHAGQYGHSGPFMAVHPLQPGMAGPQAWWPQSPWPPPCMLDTHTHSCSNSNSLVLKGVCRVSTIRKSRQLTARPSSNNSTQRRS